MAAVVHAMAQRIQGGGFKGGLPPAYDIYVGDYKRPRPGGRAGGVWEGVYLTTGDGMDTAEELAVTLGHELFHACQYQGGLGETWMRYNIWLTDATRGVRRRAPRVA